MKKLLIFILFLSPIFLFANTDKQAEKLDDGKYVARFYVTYTEISSNFPTETEITNHLCLNRDLNSTYCEYDVTEEKFPGEYHCSWLSI